MHLMFQYTFIETTNLLRSRVLQKHRLRGGECDLLLFLLSIYANMLGNYNAHHTTTLRGRGDCAVSGARARMAALVHGHAP